MGWKGNNVLNKKKLTWRKAVDKELFIRRLKGELASNEFGFIPNDKFFQSCFISKLKDGKYIKNSDNHFCHFNVLKDFIYDDDRGDTNIHFMTGDEIVVDEDFRFWL